MRTWIRSALAAAVSLGIAAPSIASVPANKSELKGFVAINTILRTRLAKPDAVSFQFAKYVGGKLADLLGTYSGPGFSGKFQNGSPNVVNMLLYYVGFSSLASDLASVCDSQAPAIQAELREDVLPKLQALCAWGTPDFPAKRDAALTDLWMALVAFDAPWDELEAWKAFAVGPDMEKASPKEAIVSLVVAALMNPYFVLQ